MSFRNFKNQLYAATVILSMLMMCHNVCGRPELRAYPSRSGLPTAQAQEILNELLTRANEDALYKELTKYERQPTSYISKWPALRDLLLTSDYDDANDLESDQLGNSRFIERLRQLAATTVDMEDIRDENKLDGNGETLMMPATNSLPTAIPFKGSRVTFKQHDTKKNVQMYRKQYMSPCHFKICNMGRKRNAHFLPVY